MSTFTDGIIDFRFVAPQLCEDFTDVGSIFATLLLNYTNTGVSMNLFLLYFGVLYFMGPMGASLFTSTTVDGRAREILHLGF